MDLLNLKEIWILVHCLLKLIILQKIRNHFNNASIISRALTVSAGPTANFLLSIILFSSIILVNGIANNEPKIGNINNIPFQELKIKTGDLVLEINGKPN